MNRRLVLILLLTLSVLTGCGGLSGDGDVATSTYNSLQEATAAGAMKSGWLPKALPRSAKHITEVHNTDSGELWATFHYSNDDVHQLTKLCVKNQSMQFPNQRRTDRDARWWPSELTSKGNIDARSRWMILQCPKIQHAESIYTAGIAVDLADQIAWYWIAK